MGRVAGWAFVWFTCFTLVASAGPITGVVDLAATAVVILGATAYTTILSLVVT